jgi:hypothetical protein
VSPFGRTNFRFFGGGDDFSGGTMTNVPNPSQLGVIVKNAKARAVIYGTYVVAIIAAGAAQVGFASLELAQPDFLVASIAVLAYLGVPVGTLAIANTNSAA